MHTFAFSLMRLLLLPRESDRGTDRARLDHSQELDREEYLDPRCRIAAVTAGYGWERALACAPRLLSRVRATAESGD